MPPLSPVLAELLARQPVWRGGAPVVQSAGEKVATGFAELDRELPGGGWPAGALTELLCAEEGIGQVQLVLPALAELSRKGARSVWISPPHLPYAPAFPAAGIEPSGIAIVEAASRRNALWVAEQALQADVCGALLLWLRGARYAELRRLALAAEKSSAICVVFRPQGEAAQPSPACLRLALAAQANGVSARIIKRRGSPALKALQLQVDRPVHAVGGAPLSSSSPRGVVARICIV